MFLYLKLGEQQEQPEEVKVLQVFPASGDWLRYVCSSFEHAASLAEQLRAKGYVADAGRTIRIQCDSWLR